MVITPKAYRKNRPKPGQKGLYRSWTKRVQSPKALVRLLGYGLLFCLSAAAFWGCAKEIPVFEGSLMRSVIVVDGNDKDWPMAPPLYFDEENRAGIRVMNDEKTICILVTIAGESLKRRFSTQGFRLTLDTQKQGTNPFSIEVQSRDSFFVRGNEKERTKDFLSDRTVLITYPHSSGEMEMSVAQAGGYGIELGMNMMEFSRLVFELKIRLDAVLPDETMDFNNPVCLMLSAAGHGQGGMPDKESGPGMSGNGQGGPGGQGPGGGGKGPGKGGPPMQKGGQANAGLFEAMFKFHLAGLP